MGKPFLSDVIVLGAAVKLDNAQYLQAKDSGGSYINVAGVNSSNVVEIGASGKVLNLIGSGIGVGITTGFYGLVHIKAAANQLAIEGSAADATIRFKNTTTSDTYIDAAAATLQFFINNSGVSTVTMRDGQVGIGITAPAAGVSLHINQPTASASAYLLLTNTTTGTSNGLYIGASGGSLDAIINNAVNGGIAFGTNNTIVMKLDNTGKLGIGITSSMLGLVHLKGSGSQLVIESTGADAQIRFKNTTTSDTYIDASGAALGFYIANSGSPAMAMRDGNPSWYKATYVSAYPSANQSISATTFTKVAANTAGVDRLSEWSTSGYTFTPTVTGDYLFTVLIGQLGLAGNRFILSIGNSSGGEVYRAYDGTNWLGNMFTYNWVYRCTGGSSYSILVYADTAFTVQSIGNAGTQIIITKAMT
jgi:hypothetical protein